MSAGRGGTAPPPLRILLVGCGRVGRTLLEILARPAEFPEVEGEVAAGPIQVVAITTGSSGALADPAGIDPAAALAALDRDGRFSAGHPAFAELDSATAVASVDYDVLVELSPLAVAQRGEPARAFVRAALERGRHAVSANKGPVAWGYRELAALAAERGVSFQFESTVMDGVPVFCLVERCLPASRVERLEGVLNSTTNVILSSMEEGLGFEESLERAREAGVVEADPEADLAGWDAAVKVTCLANVLMGAAIVPETVERIDVREIDPLRSRAAVREGRCVKLVAEAARENGRVVARLRARELPLSDPLAQVAGTSSALRLVTDLPGRLVMVEEDPDLHTTAYGVLADLLRIAGAPTPAP